MFISEAYAQGTGGGSMFGGEGMMQFLPLILIFVVFYFLLIRPQQKKMKAHREMVSAVRRGDRVVTGGGMIGQVVKVISDAEVDVQIAEGVKVRMLKSTITDVIARGEPVKGAKKGEEVEAEEEEDDEDAPALPRPSTPDVKRGGGFGGLFGPKK
jgi:preprotein translocase subunit YajC